MMKFRIFLAPLAHGVAVPGAKCALMSSQPHH
jgi:hypothetical protein